MQATAKHATKNLNWKKVSIPILRKCYSLTLCSIFLYKNSLSNHRYNYVFQDANFHFYSVINLLLYYVSFHHFNYTPTVMQFIRVKEFNFFTCALGTLRTPLFRKKDFLVLLVNAVSSTTNTVGEYIGSL